jgi:hypothetical protein
MLIGNHAQAMSDEISAIYKPKRSSRLTDKNKAYLAATCTG